jgi:hypothetical protein
MNQMDYKEALEMLRRTGFSASEIQRLNRLRRDYAANELDRAPADLRHLVSFANRECHPTRLCVP